MIITIIIIIITIIIIIIIITIIIIIIIIIIPYIYITTINYINNKSYNAKMLLQYLSLSPGDNPLWDVQL